MIHYLSTFAQPPDSKLHLDIQLKFTAPKLTSSEGLWTWLKYRAEQHRQREHTTNTTIVNPPEYQIETDWSVYAPEDMHELADWAGFLSDVLKLPWNLDGGSIWNEVTAELVNGGFYDREVESVRERG